MYFVCRPIAYTYARYKRMLFINMIEKSLDGVEWGELYTICFWDFGFFLTFKAPHLLYIIRRLSDMDGNYVF